jgi:hypothetical protein
MSLVFATQLTAVATLALAALALATAILALLAWRKQSREVRDQGEMLKFQAEEFRQLSQDREREAQERRRAQAVMVYVWSDRAAADPSTVMVHLRNTSQQPVYGVQLGWQRDGQFRGRSEHVTPIMPGETVGTGLMQPPDTLLPPSAAAAIFRDRAGIWWCARPDGSLEEEPNPPFSDEKFRPPGNPLPENPS